MSRGRVDRDAPANPTRAMRVASRYSDEDEAAGQAELGFDVSEAVRDVLKALVLSPDFETWERTGKLPTDHRGRLLGRAIVSVSHVAGGATFDQVAPAEIVSMLERSPLNRRLDYWQQLEVVAGCHAAGLSMAERQTRAILEKLEGRR